MAKPVGASTSGANISYRYEALDINQKLVTGKIKAPSEALVGYLLSEKGLKLVSLEAVTPWYSLEQALPSLFAVKSEEIISFSRQLATLLDAGITLLAALETVQGQAGTRFFKKVIGTIIDDLSAGMSFSQALLKHPKIFNAIYCKTIAVSERTGGIQTILRQMADFQEKSEMAIKKIKKALTYPVVLMVMAIGIGALLMATAMPAMLDMFLALDTELPLPTRMLVGLSNFMSNNKFILLGTAAVLIPLFIWSVKRPQSRKVLDRWLLKFPMIGAPLHATEIARFSRTTQVLLSSGLSLQEVMNIVPQTAGNTAIRDALEKVNEELIRGEGMAGPMSRNPIFPRLLTQMVMVGEESNDLPTTLGVVADFYEADAEEKTTAFTGKIQPTMTIAMALIVGFLAMAILMPMYSITGSF